MIITTPMPFREALQLAAAKRVMPTSMSSAELGQLNAQIMRLSFTSARTTLEGYLDFAKQRITELINPRTATREDGSQYTQGTDIATVRMEMKQMLGRLGYQPDPEKRGTIEDLSSDRRVELVIKTNSEMMQGFGSWLKGQDREILDEWPAQELFRAEGRKQERDWVDRFRLAGEQSGDPIGTGWTITPDRRLVALKNHAVWDSLGDRGLFEDGLGNPFPPFAFSSGMWVRNVDRKTAQSLGLVDRDTEIQPRGFDFSIGE
jgi:hypothetical protein